MAIDSSGNGWFLANLIVGGSTTQGIGMMPNIGGIIDQSVLNPAGPLGGSLTDPYNPTVLNPASFASSLAVDGAGLAWGAGGLLGANYFGLYAVTKVTLASCLPLVAMQASMEAASLQST